MRAKKLAWVATATIMLAVSGTAPAVAGPADDGEKKPIGGSAADSYEIQVPKETRERQSDLLPVAQGIEALVDPTESGRNADGFDGYLLVAIDLEANLVNLYWKGDLPEPIQEEISKHPEARVATHEVAYSQTELSDAQDALRETLSDSLLGVKGAKLTSIEHVGMREGLQVNIDYAGKGSTLDFLTPEISSRTTIPTTVKISDSNSERPVPLAQRQDDQSPWWGGSQIQLAGQWCSSGYPIKMDATGNEYLTTAFHCIYGSGSTGVVKDGVGHNLGDWKNQGSWNRKEYDVTLVKPDSATVGARIFRGNAWSTDNIDLTAASTSTVGQTVCIDGANSGVHCNVEVIAKNETRYGEDGTKLAGNVRATSQASGGTAGVNGDSGGPVYRSASGAYYGLGTISQGLTPVTCDTSTIAHNPVGCYKTVIYTSLSGLLGSFDASLN